MKKYYKNLCATLMILIGAATQMRALHGETEGFNNLAACEAQAAQLSYARYQGTLTSESTSQPGVHPLYYVAAEYDCYKQYVSGTAQFTPYIAHYTRYTFDKTELDKISDGRHAGTTYQEPYWKSYTETKNQKCTYYVNNQSYELYYPDEIYQTTQAATVSHWLDNWMYGPNDFDYWYFPMTSYDMKIQLNKYTIRDASGNCLPKGSMVATPDIYVYSEESDLVQSWYSSKTW